MQCVHTPRGLVEHDHRGVAADGGGERDPRALAARQIAWVALQESFQIELGDDLGRQGVVLFPGDAQRVECEGDLLGHRVLDEQVIGVLAHQGAVACRRRHGVRRRRRGRAARPGRPTDVPGR